MSTDRIYFAAMYKMFRSNGKSHKQAMAEIRKMRRASSRSNRAERRYWSRRR